MHFVAGRVLSPSGSQLAALYAIDRQLAAWCVLGINIVILDSFRIGSCLVLHLCQTQIDDAIRIVVANGVHIATGSFSCIVNQSIAFSHAESDIPPQIPFLG